MSGKSTIRKWICGLRFGRLVVRHPSRYNTIPIGRTRWICECDCGGLIATTADGLRRGTTSSCGCLRAEVVGAMNRTHGRAKSAEHTCWQNMKRRCMDPASTAYADYGGRGITVCDRWRRFENFLADMGPRPSPRHSLDRIDVNGNYEPANCRWATIAVQSRNRRNSRLTESDVARIKTRLAAGEVQAALAREYRVSTSLVSAIATGVSGNNIEAA